MVHNIWQTINEYPILKDLLVMIGLVFLSGILFFITKRYVLRFVRYLMNQTKVTWDNTLFEKGVFNGLPQLIPALIIYQGMEFLPLFAEPVQRLINVWVVLIFMSFITKLLNGGLEIYNTYPISRRRPIKSYVQIFLIFLYISVTITIISMLIGQSPLIFLSGLGALAAVLMLMFQDTILGFVASMQINGNDLIRVGDWLEIPGFNADGDVIEVALHTVKIQNWDRTISVIPTHKLINNSFKNWRGMQEAGGRRIKRSILIDQTSVSFCSEAMIEEFSKIQVLQEYIKDKQVEIATYNEEHGVDSSVLVNGRRMTNLGTFRAYLAAYLHQHPGIHQQLTFLIRQLQPTVEGIPIEIYVFTNDTNWANYEGIQSDIFDHILAVIPEFGLRVSQVPTGHDLRTLLRSQTQVSENVETF